MIAPRWLSGALIAVALTACSSPGPRPSPSVTSAAIPTATSAPIPAATASGSGSAGPTAVPVEPAAAPAPAAAAPDIWTKHLTIPSIGVDTEVQVSEVITLPAGGGGGGGGIGSCVSPPSTGASPEAGASPQAGSPPAPAAPSRTFTVPSEGIATPKDAFDYLERRSWIFGHSRWLGIPGVFFALQRIDHGDELYVDGVDRVTGELITRARFVVTGIYLSDIGSGGDLVAGERIGGPGTPLVILQTSVRESGPDRPWILDRKTVMAKAENTVEGSLDDPCKYLLLFVVAELAP